MFALIREPKELDRRGRSQQAAGGAQAERADKTLLLMTLESLAVVLAGLVEIKGTNCKQPVESRRRVQRPTETSLGVKVKRPIVLHTDAIMSIPFQPVSSLCCVVSPPASAGL
jgi:hypothetical protein